jgi:hypothetical protein
MSVTPELPPSTDLLPQSTCFAFLETAQPHTPAQAYEEYCNRREQAGLQHPLYYASTTITSGGFRRDEDMSVSDAIANNSRFARKIIDEGLLRRNIDPAHIVLPSELGKVPGWKQTDYLQFWMYIIRAVHPDSAHLLEDQQFRNLDSELPSIGERMESAPSYDDKKDAYIQFVQKFRALQASPIFKEALTPHWQAPAVIPTFDNGMSLGCSAEYYFAETLLPEWYLATKSEELQQSVAHFLGEGAMVAGITAGVEIHSFENNGRLLKEYYDSQP